MNELERLAGSVLVCGFGGLEAPIEVRRWLEQGACGGVILFRRNIDGPRQAAALIESCFADTDSALPPLVCVDQEGGRVARFGEPVLQLPSMRELASAGDLELTRDAARVLATQLRAIGVTLNFAPVLDVDTNPLNPIIGDRAFGATPEVVAEQALAFAAGLHEGGVLACGKHFPGHGDTDLDSHLARPILRHDRARLDAVELLPFRAAVRELASIMTAHVVFEALDPGVPATMSAAVLEGLLRGELGFEGAIVSDDLEMKAITASHEIEEAGMRAIESGCDVLLVCSDLDAATRLREALALRAGQSEPFRLRLAEARARTDALRRRILELPPALTLENALDSDEARSIEERLQQLA